MSRKEYIGREKIKKQEQSRIVENLKAFLNNPPSMENLKEKVAHLEKGGKWEERPHAGVGEISIPDEDLLFDTLAIMEEASFIPKLSAFKLFSAAVVDRRRNPGETVPYFVLMIGIGEVNAEGRQNSTVRIVKI